MVTRRVLIVDDDERIGALIARVAEGLGFEALSVTDPELFDSTLCVYEPDVVFLDLKMSAIDGIELLRLLGERRTTIGEAGQRVILASGLDGRVLETAHALGVSLDLDMGEPLAKPFEIADIRSRLAAPARPGCEPRAECDIDGDALRHAFGEDQLTLFYQPMVDLVNREVLGVEALMRWQHPDHGLVAPGQFIPVAEDCALIEPLTLWAIERAVRDHAGWAALGYHLDLSVNLSPLLLDDLALPDRIAGILESHGFPHDRLVLEVTEDRPIRQVGNAMDVLARLRLKGFRLALDDFGTGYSSLDHLYRLPYGELKIDKSFVTHSARDRNAATIVRVATELAGAIGLRVVAEGVENARVLEWLAEIGCNVAQGLHIAPPLETDRLAAWLERRTRIEALEAAATG